MMSETHSTTYNLSAVRELHIEITSRCNLRCPQCLRCLSDGRENPNLPLTELRMGDICRLFPQRFIQQLHLMYMSGTYGDAIVARDTLEVFRYFRDANPDIRLKMYTNGSARSADWWAQLAKTINRCVFAIDGLSDTNHLYRRGSSWKRVMASATAFIDAGGDAEWAFLVFQHNQHQVEEAKQLSEKLGFASFTVKSSGRFLSSSGRANEAPVLNRCGAVEYFLRPPSADHLQNQAATKFGEIVHCEADLRSYLESTPITCKAVKEHTMYVSAEGLVFPCCWLSVLYRRPEDNSGADFIGLSISFRAEKRLSMGCDSRLKRSQMARFIATIFHPHGYHIAKPDLGPAR